jgi:hypothetical protein
MSYISRVSTGKKLAVTWTGASGQYGYVSAVNRRTGNLGPAANLKAQAYIYDHIREK